MILNATHQGRALSFELWPHLKPLNWIHPSYWGEKGEFLNTAPEAGIRKVAALAQRGGFGRPDASKNIPDFAADDSLLVGCAATMLDAENIYLDPAQTPAIAQRLKWFRETGPAVPVGILDNWLWPAMGGNNDTWAKSSAAPIDDVRKKLDAAAPVLSQCDFIAFMPYLIGPDWVNRDKDYALTVASQFRAVNPHIPIIALVMPRWSGANFPYENHLIPPVVGCGYVQLLQSAGLDVAVWGNVREIAAVYGPTLRSS